MAMVCVLPAMAQELPSIVAMKSAAEAFLASLDDAGRAKAGFAFDSI
jgi:hypothetical protein